MRPPSNLFESPFSSTTSLYPPSQPQQQQEQQQSRWLERTPLRRRENDSFAPSYSSSSNINPMTQQQQQQQGTAATTTTTNLAELPFQSYNRRRRSNNGSGTGKDGWIKYTMRAVLLSPVIVLVLWSIGAMMFTHHHRQVLVNGGKLSQQLQHQLQSQQQYGPPRRGMPAVRILAPTNNNNNNNKHIINNSRSNQNRHNRNNINNNNMIGKFGAGIFTAVDAVGSAFGNPLGGNGQNHHPINKIVPVIGPLGAASEFQAPLMEAAMIASSQSQQQDQASHVLAGLVTNQLSNYRVVDGTIVRPRPAPMPRNAGGLVTTESYAAEAALAAEGVIQQHLNQPQQQQHLQQQRLQQEQPLLLQQEDRIIVVQPPNLPRMMEPVIQVMEDGSNPVLVTGELPLLAAPDQQPQVLLDQEQQQQQQLLGAAGPALLPAMDADAPLRGQRQMSPPASYPHGHHHHHLRGSGSQNPNDHVTYLYYDPRQVLTDQEGGLLYLPDTVYDARGRPLLLSALQNVARSIVVEPPKGMIHHNLTNTTTTYLNISHAHPSTIQTPVHDHRREIVNPAMLAAALPLASSTTDRFASSKAFLSNGVNWATQSTTTMGNNSTDQSIIVSTMGVMALLLGAISARRLRNSRSLLSFCIENESMMQDEVAYDTAYTVSGDSYNTFGPGGWKGDLEKFDV